MWIVCQAALQELSQVKEKATNKNHDTQIKAPYLAGKLKKQFGKNYRNSTSIQTQIHEHLLVIKSLTLSRTCIPNWTCGGGKRFPCWPNGWRGPMKGLGWLGGPPCWFMPTIPWWPWWGGRLGLGGSLGKSPGGPWPGGLKAGPGGQKPMWPWPGSCCCWWRLWGLLFIRGLGPGWSNMCCPGNRVDSARSAPKRGRPNNNNTTTEMSVFGLVSQFQYISNSLSRCIVLWQGKQKQTTLSRWNGKQQRLYLNPH